MKNVFFAGAFATGLGLCGPALAHPHVFIDAKAVYQIDDAGQLQSLRITWIYDAFTSLALIEALALDQDNDGVLSEADLARVVQAQTIWPDHFQGDTYLEIAGQPVPLGRPAAGAADMEDLRISVSFDLPLRQAIAASPEVELRLYDPGYYYAYATLEAMASGPCAATITRFEADQASSALQAQLARLSREETPEQDGIGRRFADIVRLECA